jgi:flagellar basal-body rod protein FlgF
MQNALLVGLSRQMALRDQLDVIANNIANIDTTGYKADNELFSQYLMPNAGDGNFSGSGQQVAFVEDRGTWIDFSQGPIEHTGDPLDVAIQGKAFLAVQTPNGVRYTRNGALSRNSSGQLVTSAGYPVLGTNGPITFQPDDHNVIISPSGIITVREGASAADSPRGQLQLVGFAQMQQLQKDGNSTFAAPPGVTPGPAPQGAGVLQGAIEKSNVNAVAEITRMIELTQSYTDITGVLQQQSDQRQNALNQLAQTPTG